MASNISGANSEGSFPLFGGAESECAFSSLASSRFRQGDQEAEVSEQTALPPPSNVNFGHAVGAAWESLSSETVEPIWNSGFWKCIFGDEELGHGLELKFKRPYPVDETRQQTDKEDDVIKKLCLRESAAGSEPLYKLCVKSSDNITSLGKNRGKLICNVH